ncbi:MAG: hypothetical protein CME60_05265 [Halobacteriovoraceae bacterium]|nr:hypothetical protein [Halobacteriovoraceae bacterium]
MKSIRISHFGAISLFIFILGFSYFYRGALFYSSFNLDEVILTLSSQNIKVEEYALYKERVGGVVDAFLANRTFGSLDPGFFTLILHIWTKFSHSTFWLRFLPFCFFLGLLIGLPLFLTRESSTQTQIEQEKAERRRGMPLVYCFYSLFLFSIHPLVMDHAFTIRPYAMEMLGTLYLFFFIQNMRYKCSKSNIAMMLLLCFFIGSRYYLWINMAWAFIALMIVDRRNIQNSIQDTLKLLAIPFSFCLFILVLVFSFQAKTLDTGYMEIYYGSYSQWIKELLGSTSVKLFLSYPLYLGITKSFFKRKWQRNESVYFLFLIFSFLGYLLAHLFEISPFRLNERFSLGFHIMGIVSFSLLGREVMEIIYRYKRELALLISLFSLFFAFRLSYDFEQKSDLIPIVQYVRKNVSSNEMIYCDAISCSMVRFLKDFTGHKDLSNTNWPNFKLKEKRENQEDWSLEKGLYMTITPINHLGPLGRELEVKKAKILEGYYYQRLFLYD